MLVIYLKSKNELRAKLYGWCWYKIYWRRVQINMLKAKISIGLKCILTGMIYALVTCVVQVPVANLIFKLLNIKSDTTLEESQLPLLLLSILITGIGLAFFYYFYGHLFESKKRWVRNLKFSAFIYFSNYIPQVFFLDATNGISKLLKGGFPVIQVELFDLIILIITIMLMVQFMPCRCTSNNKDIKDNWLKNIISALVFASSLTIISEVVLPIFGFANMADGLQVANENKLFFYIVMYIGFLIAGILMAFMNNKAEKSGSSNFILAFIILIWCSFDLTMIPLGFGIIATILFIIESIVSAVLQYLTLIKLND